MLNRGMMFALLAAPAVNSAAALVCGGAVAPAGLGLALGIASGYLLTHAVSTGWTSTLQDGIVRFRERPALFLFLLVLLCAGYAGGFFAPWGLHQL